MILSLISCIGLTLILKYGAPTKVIRDLFNKFVPGLFCCALCLGFWSGVVHSLVLLMIEPSYQIIFVPCAAAALSWFADNIICSVEMVEIYIKDRLNSHE